MIQRHVTRLFAIAASFLASVGAYAAAPAGVTAPSVTVSGADLSVTWPAVTTDLYGDDATIVNYNLYRGTSPDFAPDYTGGSNRIAQPASASYTDVGVATDSNDYFYRLTAVASGGAESLLPSPLAYKRVLNLTFTPGTDNRFWLHPPLQSSLAVAADVLSLSPAIARVGRFDPTTQVYQWWLDDSTGTNFSLNVGEPVAVEITADTTLVLVGSEPPTQIALNHNAANFNRQWLGQPLDSPTVSASVLSAQIPNLTKLATPVSGAYQSWFMLDGQWMGDDFAVTPGLALMASVTASGAFQSASLTPDVETTATPPLGYEAISVDLSAQLSIASTAIASYQWDFEGDGVFDESGAGAPDSTHFYQGSNSYRPTLLITTTSGHRGLAWTTLDLQSLNIDFSVGGFAPLNGESATISYTLPQSGNLSVHIYDAEGNLVKTLLNAAPQGSGAGQVAWDGLDGLGNTVADGSYYVVMQFEVDGHTSIWDTRASSGGVDISQQLTALSVSNTLSPLEGQYVNISYNLPQNAQVSIRLVNGSGAVIRHLLTNALRNAGSHTEIWDGTDDSGQVVTPGTSFTAEIDTLSLASNSLVAKGSTPELSAISASPLRFSPAINPYGPVTNEAVQVDFTLNVSADVTLRVFSQNGTLVRSQTLSAQPAGTGSINWNGRNDGGIRLTDGLYTLSIQAVDSHGQRSAPFNLQTELFY